MRSYRSSLLLWTCIACLGVVPWDSINLTKYSSKAIATEDLVTNSPHPLKASFDKNHLAIVQTEEIAPVTEENSTPEPTPTNTPSLAPIIKPVSSEKTTPSPSVKPKETIVKTYPVSWRWWALGGVTALVCIGGILSLLLKFFGGEIEDLDPESPPDQTTSNHNSSKESLNSQKDIHHLENGINNYNGSVLAVSEPSQTKSYPQEPLPVGNTPRLPKIDIVEELIKDLQSSDPIKRRKVIWDLGQRGDSRAVQSLVDLLIDSDSQQRSLILAALSEIGSRTLKPMNRALGISLQDESPDVRKNAIRDLMRIYELVFQISHLLRHSVDDPDPEVQETARWALAQLNRLRILSGGMEHQPVLQDSVNLPENPPIS